MSIDEIVKNSDAQVNLKDFILNYWEVVYLSEFNINGVKLAYKNYKTYIKNCKENNINYKIPVYIEHNEAIENHFKRNYK